MPVPTCLTIATSDSGGGAGIQADLKAFAAAGVHGMSAIVALTAQNTREVVAVHEVPPWFIRAQLDGLDARVSTVEAKIDNLRSDLQTLKAEVQSLKVQLEALPRILAEMLDERERRGR